MTLPRIYHGASQIVTPEKMGTAPMRAEGVTLHYTAADDDVEAVRKALLQKGLGYHLVITRDGRVTQLTYLDLRVNHAGHALWNDRSPNRRHISVAISSWGKLSPHGVGYRSWAGVEPRFVVLRPGNVGDEISAWEAATLAQEGALQAILKWVISYGIDPKNICGHDECAIPAGRKLDPGGVLSRTVAEIRKSLTR